MDQRFLPGKNLSRPCSSCPATERSSTELRLAAVSAVQQRPASPASPLLIAPADGTPAADFVQALKWAGYF